MAVIIDIGIKQGTETTTNNRAIDQQNGVKSAKTGQNVASTVGVVAATMVAKQTLNYATSNIGKYTGNSRLQTKINLGKSVFEAGVGLLGSIATGNPVIIATTLTSMAIGIGTSVIDANWKERMDEIEVQRRRTRAGYNSYGQLVGWRH